MTTSAQERAPSVTATRPSTAWLRFCAAWAVIFLQFGPYLSMLMREETRRLRMWTTGDTLQLFGGMMALALLLTTVSSALRRWRWRWRGCERLFNHAFVVALGAGLLTNLWYHTMRPVGYSIGQVDTEVRTLWLVMFALVGYSLARPRFPLVRGARNVALIIAPTVLIVGADLLRRPSYPALMDALPSGAPAAAAAQREPQTSSATPVYLFVMDGWSYGRSYENGRLQDWFERLGPFADQAFVFHDARSPGESTEQSMPGILLQADLPVKWGDAVVGMQSETGEVVSTSKFDSVFGLVDDRYTRCVVGYFMPYRLLLGDQVDVVRNYYWPLYNRSRSAVLNLGLDTFGAMIYWTDPWAGLVHRKLRRRILDHMALMTYANLSADILHIITAGPRQTMALFHYPLPHDPYLLDESGCYRGHHVRGGWVDHSIWPEYRRNLVNLDRVLGGWLEAMRSSGRFDDALIIVTSDHSWVYDKEAAPQDASHVPLLIKLPGQSTRHDVERRVQTWRLGRLIEAVLAGRATPEDVAAVVEPLTALRGLDQPLATRRSPQVILEAADPGNRVQDLAERAVGASMQSADLTLTKH